VKLTKKAYGWDPENSSLFHRQRSIILGKRSRREILRKKNGKKKFSEYKEMHREAAAELENVRQGNWAMHGRMHFPNSVVKPVPWQRAKHRAKFSMP